MFVILMISTFQVNDAIRTVTRMDHTSNTDDYEVVLTELCFRVEEMCKMERWYRTSFMFYPLVVMMRLFKSFDAQPRLSVVTRTLYKATPGMVHFSIVFASVYICMVVNGVLLFGQNTEEFADFFRGFFTAFRVMFGDWDWVAMKEVGRYPWAVPWFWLFMMTIAVVLLNMLLAILMDAYTEVKNDIEDAQTLPTQVSEMIRRHRQSKRNERVKLNDIWASFLALMKDEKDMLQSDRSITAEDLLSEVERMKKNQAERTIKNAKKEKERRETERFTQDDVLNILEGINIKTALVKENVRKLRKSVEVYDQNFSRAELAANTSSVEQRQQMVNAVQAIIDGLGEEVGDFLTSRVEMQGFNLRQKEIEIAQHNMLVCIKDSHHVLQRVCDMSDAALQELAAQKEASIRRQKRQVHEEDDNTLATAALGFFERCEGGKQARDVPNQVQVVQIGTRTDSKDPASRSKSNAQP